MSSFYVTFRDVIKEGDEILIYEHYSGELIFEYNRFKEADKEAFKEYQDLLLECADSLVQDP